MKITVRMLGLAAASLALTLVTAACGESVNAPSPQPEIQPPAPVQTFALSGTIWEATESGNAPLEGASVTNWSTADTAVTDAAGNYTLHGVPAGFAQLIVSKEGYADQYLELMIDGDARLDATLLRQAE